MDRDDGAGVTRHISECAAALTYGALPPELVELTKQIILDTLGVAVGASGLAPEKLQSSIQPGPTRCRPIITWNLSHDIPHRALRLII